MFRGCLNEKKKKKKAKSPHGNDYVRFCRLIKELHVLSGHELGTMKDAINCIKEIKGKSE